MKTYGLADYIGLLTQQLGAGWDGPVQVEYSAVQTMGAEEDVIEFRGKIRRRARVATK